MNSFSADETVHGLGTEALREAATSGTLRLQRKNHGKWRRSAALMTAALIVIAGAVMGTLVYRAKEAPYDVVREYVEALNEGDIERALSLLHPESELRGSFDARAERDRLAAHGVAPLRIRSAHATYLTGSRASIRVEMGDGSEGGNLWVFKLSREDGGWHIVTYENP